MRIFDFIDLAIKIPMKSVHTLFFNGSLKLVIHKYLRVIKAHKKVSPNSTFSTINEPMLMLQLKGEEKEETERKINS